MTLATVIAICGGITHGPLTEACIRARYELICSVPEVEAIRDDDPALPLFRDPGEDIEDSKIDLAIERANGCD